jgi:ribosomal protein RSM22 (predicted rRNA methylase)
MPTLLSSTYAVPLGEDWRAALDQVARAHRWPTTAEPAQLGALVRALSDAYNAPTPPPGRAVASSGPALAARLGFSFARDVPKAAGAVRELVAAGELGAGRGASEPIRTLDVGSGLGATTWGVARALAAAGRTCTMQVTWTDEDSLALDVARALAKAREHREGGVTLDVRAERRPLTTGGRRDADAVAGPGPWDLVLLGQVLSELDGALEPEERARAHADLVSGLVGKLAPGGALVVVEPALRERTRHLHAVRDAVLAEGGATVFAPCLHDAPCPALEVEGEWCHEDLAVDLPAWLEPVARAAGLRWQGLTFSYLVLRRRGERTLADVLPGAEGELRARVISGPLVSKGKREHFVCAACPSGAERTRVSRLDRDGTPANAAWDSVARGDVISLRPPPDAKKQRLARESSVAVLSPRSR